MARRGRTELAAQVCSQGSPVTQGGHRKFEYICECGRSDRNKIQGDNVGSRQCRTRSKSPGVRQSWAQVQPSPTSCTIFSGSFTSLSLSVPIFQMGIITAPRSKGKHIRNNFSKLPVAQEVLSNHPVLQVLQEILREARRGPSRSEME